MIASLVMNIAIKWGSDGKKPVKLTDIMDFMPQWDTTAPKEVPVQSVEDMKQVFKDIIAAQNSRKKVKVNKTRPPVNLKKKKDG